MAAQKVARSSDEAVSAWDEVSSVSRKVVPAENEAMPTQNDVVSEENQAASMQSHTASSENEASQETAIWPSTGQAPACVNAPGYPVKTQPTSIACTAPLGTATWISTEIPSAPTYSQHMDEPGLLGDV